eukprot:SAG31_NODE_3063_length_4730_cov_6.014900_2_plen_851_part_00
MRADGTSFLLKFPAGAGLTYRILAVLKEDSAAAHLRLAIFPPEAIGSASSTGAAGGSACQLPPSAQGLLQSKDVTEMTFGTWGLPEHGQTWGQQHHCPDLTRVGPPEQGGCDGQYRYFPGQSFPTNHTWDWTAPFTANYVLQVTANCDVPFYDDPTQPGCTVTADGIECDDDRVTQCAAAIGLTIRVIDRSVHVKHTFEVPVTQEVLDSIELQQQMADLFGLQQQPAVVFPLSISPLDCHIPENRAKSVCQSVAVGGRRHLQVQRSADVDHACPQSSFEARASAMQATCGLSSLDAVDPLLQGQCPSLECAAELPSLLEDCAERITEFTRQIGTEAQFYVALKDSQLASNCVTMNRTAPAAASVQVEFRAPNRVVADQLIQEHLQMVHKTFSHLPGRVDESNGGHRMLEDERKDVRRAQSVDERPLCFGNADASVDDGTRCGGRRQLDSDYEKDKEIRRLKAELDKSKAETEAAIQRSTEKDQIITQQAEVVERQAKTIEKQATEIAFHKKLHRLRQTALTRQNVSVTTRRNQTAVGRRTQVVGLGDSSVLRSARVGADRSVKACAVHPCELSDGICQNGGTCVEVVGMGGGAVPFECQCAGGFGGDRCQTDLCAGMDCGDHGECVSGSCECAAGVCGDHCQHIAPWGQTACGGMREPGMFCGTRDRYTDFGTDKSESECVALCMAAGLQECNAVSYNARDGQCSPGHCEDEGHCSAYKGCSATAVDGRCDTIWMPCPMDGCGNQTAAFDWCLGDDCGEHGECVGGLCECSGGWSGGRCERAPCCTSRWGARPGPLGAQGRAGRCGDNCGCCFDSDYWSGDMEWCDSSTPGWDTGTYPGWTPGCPCDRTC